MEGRTFPRIKVDGVSATVRPKGFLFAHGEQETVEILDIGPCGLCLRSSRRMKPDDRMEIVLSLPQGRKIKCCGIVRHCRRLEAGFAVGVEFTRCSGRDKCFLEGHLLQIGGIDPAHFHRPLKDRVRTLRTALELTVSELSDLTDVPSQQIVAIEFGMERRPPRAVLERLASALGISVEHLAAEPPPESRQETVEQVFRSLATR